MSDIQLTINGCCLLRDERGKRLDRLTRDIEVCETKRNLFKYFIRELKLIKRRLKMNDIKMPKISLCSIETRYNRG